MTTSPYRALPSVGCLLAGARLQELAGVEGLRAGRSGYADGVALRVARV